MKQQFIFLIDEYKRKYIKCCWHWEEKIHRLIFLWSIHKQIGSFTVISQFLFNCRNIINKPDYFFIPE
jgi:hypothetical protein